jgi:hypothetical protein
MGDIEHVNAGLPWAAHDNQQLAEWLMAGVSLGEIASRMGRTSAGIRSQAVKLAPADLGLGAGEVIGWLRVQLRHGHDWRKTLEERSARPTRNGDRWGGSENERLVGELQGQQSWEAIARAHDRTKGAILAQAARLLVLDDETVTWSRSKKAEKLRRELQADPGYDWERALQVNQASVRSPAWVFVGVGRSPDGARHVRVAATEAAAERITAGANVPVGTVWEIVERAVLPDYAVADSTI